MAVFEFGLEGRRDVLVAEGFQEVVLTRVAGLHQRVGEFHDVMGGFAVACHAGLRGPEEGFVGLVDQER